MGKDMRQYQPVAMRSVPLRIRNRIGDVWRMTRRTMASFGPIFIIWGAWHLWKLLIAGGTNMPGDMAGLVADLGTLVDTLALPAMLMTGFIGCVKILLLLPVSSQDED